MINIAIMTVSRSRNYLHKVVDHLPKKIPIRLVVGSPNYDYLERYRNSSRIEIIGVDPREWERFKNYSIVYRASWNYWRCFVHGCRDDRYGGLLILEDDVLPANSWMQRLRRTIEAIEVEYGQDYILALYTAYTKLAKPLHKSQLYQIYPARDFLGTQAMYYPHSVRKAFAEYLKQEGVDQFRMPYDFLLSEYVRSTGYPLFTTTPCLFQHIGEISTGLCLKFHRAGDFSKG